MEVTSMNNYSIPSIETSNNIRLSVDNSDLPVNTRSSDIKLDETMMDLEDVKNFLFMLIGVESSSGSTEIQAVYVPSGTTPSAGSGYVVVEYAQL